VNFDKSNAGTNQRGMMGGLLAGWSVNLPMLSMFRKEEAPTGGLIPREETSQAEASGIGLEFHPATIIRS
jgi:hypothetical protein